MESVIKYPSFGQIVGEPKKFTCRDGLILSGKIVAIASGVGALAGNFFGAIIGIIVGIALATIVFLGFFIFNRVNKHLQQVELANSETQPRLGKYIPTDVQVLNRVEDSFQIKKDLIAIAETSIEISPNFAGGDILQEVLDLVEDRIKLKPQLKVHILVSEDHLSQLDIDRLRRLNKDYPDQFFSITSKRIYNAFPFDHTEENHVKVLIVDGKYFCSGGGALHRPAVHSEPYTHTETIKEPALVKKLPECTMDTDIAGRGDLSHVLRRQFFYLLQKWENRTTKNCQDRFFDIKGQPQGTLSSFDSPSLIKGAKVKCIVSGPEHRKGNAITRKLVKRISKAQKRIQFALLHFLPVKSVKDALAATKAKIQLHSNGTLGCLNYPSMFTSMNRTFYHLVDEVYEHREAGLYHRKVSIFDDDRVCIGSNNFGRKSDQCDDEMMLLVKDHRVVKEVRAGIEKDSTKVTPLTGKDLKKIRSKAMVLGALLRGIMTSFAV